MDNEKIQKNWEYIFNRNRGDYVRLRIYRWMVEEDKKGLFSIFKKYYKDEKSPEERMKDNLLKVYGERNGTLVFQKLKKDLDEGKADDIQTQINKHINNLIYKNSMLCLNSNKYELDKRLDLELSIYAWAIMENDKRVHIVSGPNLDEYWYCPRKVVMPLCSDLKAIIKPEIEKIRRGLPKPNPEADPESIDSADIYDVELDTCDICISKLTGEDGWDEKMHKLLNSLKCYDVEVAFNSINDTLDYLGEDYEGRELSSAIPGQDWDVYISTNKAKRLSAAYSILFDRKMFKDAITIIPTRESFEQFDAQLKEIDKKFDRQSRGEDCQLAKLYASLRFYEKTKNNNQALLSELKKKGYLDNNDVKTLERMDKVCKLFEQLKDKDVDKAVANLFGKYGKEEKIIKMSFAVLMSESGNERYENFSTKVISSLDKQPQGQNKKSNEIESNQKPTTIRRNPIDKTKGGKGGR